MPPSDARPTLGHALQLRDISQRFGAVVAANGISLDIKPGELVSLLGPSGCGKTTLLKIVAGFQRQTAGDVCVDGHSITHLPPNARRIGIVFQNYALFPHMTVAQNVAYGPQAAGLPRDRVAAVVAEMLDLVRMAAFRDRLPRDLSGGQQQRVALARCLAIQPNILLLDEPFSALDKNLRLDMQIEIKRLQRQSGITTVLVTHDQEEALAMSDRIAVLSGGNLEQFASPTDIYDRPASVFVNTFVGSANLLRGAITESSGQTTSVRLDGGAVVTAAVPPPSAAGARVLLSVRPERIRLSRSPEPHWPGGAVLSGHVTAELPVGAALIYQVALADGSTVKVVQDRAAALPDDALGGAVFLSIDPARISGIFPDPHTGKHT
jgi:putative spermidine/putrescine transport system ATP-binding protein